MLADLNGLQVLVLNLLFGVEFFSCLDDFFIVNKYEGSEYFCITNSSFALSWNVELNSAQELPSVSRYLPISHDYWNAGCTDFHQQQWQCHNVFSREIIRDRRWEGTQVHKTDHQQDSPFVTYKLERATKSLSNDFQIALSIRTEPEVHIFFCDARFNCYLLILQESDGLQSGIQKCTSIQTDGKLPGTPCKMLKAKIKHTPNATKFLSKDKWNHFILSKKQNRITFKHSNGEEILSYEDLEDSVYLIRYLILSSGLNTGLWKKHDIEYVETSQPGITEFETPVYLIDGHICMSIFVRMCQTCEMRIEFKSVNNKSEVLAQETYTSEQSTGWSEIRFSKSGINARQVVFTVTTFNGDSDPNQFWDLSDVKQCHKDGFRMIQLDDMASCQLMAPETKVISLNNEISVTSSSKSDFDHCEEETVSKYCIPCDWFLGENCDRLKVCEQFSNRFKCSCSAGYQKDVFNNCVNPCRGCTYGHECKKRSRYCPSCNKVTSKCTFCSNGYRGSKCEKPPLPIFKNTPRVSHVEYTKATIAMENFDLLRSGAIVGPYDTYTIQHKRADVDDQTWITYSENYKFGQPASITIKELKAGTKYKVRSIVTNAKNDDGDEVPITEFTTRCDDITEEDVVVNSSQSTANITVLEERQSYICTFKPSKVVLQPAADSGRFAYYAEFFYINVRGLRPFQNYKVVIIIDGGHINKITKTFKTTEGIPEEVKNLFGKPLDNTTVQLEWEEPAHIYGDFQYYVVKSKIAHYLACNGNPVTYQSETTTESTTTLAIVSNLIPYTENLFHVFAKNTKFDGLPTAIYLNTSQSEIIGDEEFPELESRVIRNRSVQLKFSKISCSKLKGPLLIIITLTCSQQWCTKNQTEELEYSQSSLSKSISVFPFSRYTLMFRFCRNNSTCSSITKQDTFQTDVDTPNIVSNLSVFSKTETSISVRWQPPYPPSGILELYNIKSVLNERRDFGNVSNSPCSLWPEFQCFTLTGLQSNQIYYVELRAKNEEPDSFGLLTTTTGITKTEPSKPPPGLENIWTLDNDLIITWEHPTEANGDITHFNISVLSSVSNQSPQIYETLQVMKEQYTAQYRYDISSNKLLPSTVYRITVAAFNDLDGEAAFLLDFSPPEIPTFETDPKFETANHTIEVETFEIENFSKNKNYNLSIFVSDEDVETISHLTKRQLFDKLPEFRSVYECRQYKTAGKFIIGGNSNPKNDCKSERLDLRPETHYNVIVVLRNTDMNTAKTGYKFYTYDAYTPGEAREEPKVVALLSLLILLPVIAIAIIIFYKRRSILEQANSLKRNILGDDAEAPEEETPLAPIITLVNPNQEIPSKDRSTLTVEQCEKERRQQELVPYCSGRSDIENKTDQISSQVKTKNKNINKNTVEKNQNSNLNSKLVAAKGFKAYFETALENHELKNQYENIFETITKLEMLEDNKLRSEFVNMDFSNGQPIKKAYFITKLPTTSQFNEFWRTVVNENVNHIILFAHFHPNKKKIKSYWPDVGKSIDYGDVTIECNLSQRYSFYTYREFSLKCGNMIREIHQLHLSLPLNDNRYLSSFNYVQFFQQMSKIPLSCKSPILIHSSSGMRGSSFALLCNISLRHVQKHGAVDFLSNYKRLLQINNEMKIDFDHYVAAHAIVADAIHYMDTSISCNSLRGSYSER